MSDYEKTSRDYLQNWRNAQVRVTELEAKLTKEKQHNANYLAEAKKSCAAWEEAGKKLTEANVKVELAKAVVDSQMHARRTQMLTWHDPTVDALAIALQGDKEDG